MVIAHVGQCREPADAGHVQIEKQQIRIGVRFHDLVQAREAVRFVNHGAGHAVVNRVDQRLPKQGMIIRNDKIAAIR